jgi:hypothetical protein
MPTPLQLQTWLEEAYVARHRLSTGVRAVSLQHADRRITYNETNARDLDAYIARLTREINAAAGASRKRRIIRLTQTGTGL